MAETATNVATESFRTIGSSEAIPNDSVVTYYFEDNKRRIAVARVENRLYAFDDLCTCAVMACPLSGGLLVGTSIMCQCHGSRFDITTGVVINGPATTLLKMYQVRESDGTVQIRV